jgi:hypothetical protein
MASERGEVKYPGKESKDSKGNVLAPFGGKILLSPPILGHNQRVYALEQPFLFF